MIVGGFMRLAAIIENEDELSYIYLKKNDKLAGFTYRDGLFMLVSDDAMKVLDGFKLGKERQDLGIEDGYLVMLDVKTGFKHFFKDGVESFTKFYLSNGEPATVYLESKEGSFKKKAKKFLIAGVSVVFTSMLVFGAVIAAMNTIFPVRYDESMGILFYNPIIEESVYCHRGEFIKYEGGDIYEKIVNEIRNSANLDENEKEFLCNEELLRSITPYYEGTVSEIVAQIHHHDIDLIPFTEEESTDLNVYGFFDHDHFLHLRNYTSSSQLKDDISTKDSAGHEHVHMLQANFDLAFLSESVATIMSHEFYLNSSNGEIPYFYSFGVKYTKVLMEILGPDVIQDRLFRKGSKAFEEAIKPYLNDKDYKSFMRLMKLKPLDSEFSLEDASELHDLVSKLYMAKFGTSIEENGLLRAIMENGDYSRVYFSKSLAESKPSYYVGSFTLSFEEFCEKYSPQFYESVPVDSYGEWKDLSHEKLLSKDFTIVTTGGGLASRRIVVDSTKVRDTGNGLEGEIDLQEYPKIDLQEAIDKNLVMVIYSANLEVSPEVYKANFASGKFHFTYDGEDEIKGYINQVTSEFCGEEKIQIDEIVVSQDVNMIL